MAWIPLATQLFGAGASLFGGGQTEADKLQEQVLKNQVAMQPLANSMYNQAAGNLNKSAGYYAPIVGGSRSAAMGALSPELQGAANRLNTGRQSLINLGNLTGGY